MAVHQLPGRVREFANYLDGLLARVDQSGGWCGVFWQRDPEGMRACLDGREMPPWDVVESLLQDLAAVYGPATAEAEAERARALHAAALLAYDLRPGGRDALRDRLDVMLREQRYAAERQAELGHALTAATTRREADALRLDLAWAQDDHHRATRRCAELRARMAEADWHTTAGGPAQDIRADRPADGGVFHGEDGPWPGGADETAREHAPRHPAPATPGPTAPEAEQPAPAQEPPAPTAKQRKRRRGSARFAGMAEDEDAPAVVAPTVLPELPAVPVATGPGPRGARFAGADEARGPRPEPWAEEPDGTDREETAEKVGLLVRLRGEGRSGEAHALLAEIAYWPAARYPLLADQMQRAGLGADWATLLWEAASLPADRLVAAADALVAAGRGTDGEQILRQGVARPAAEIGQAVLALLAEDRHREAGALLDAYVRVRTPEEAARSAEPDPGTLVPLLVAAGRRVSEERHWDLVHALRVAGHAA